MSEIKITAEPRTEFGKGAARRLRRADKIPAVLYEHGRVPIHVSLPGHETMLALKASNALLSIDVESDSHLAIPKQIQRDPLKGFIEHVDLLLVRKGEKVTVDVPIHVVGEAVRGTLVVTETNEITLEAEATHIPEYVEVFINDLDAGDQVQAGGLALPEGTSLAIDPDTLIVNVTAAPTAEEVEAELAEAEAGAGIAHDEPEATEEGSAAAEGASGE